MKQRFALVLGVGLLLSPVGPAVAQNVVEVPIARQPQVAMPGAEKIVLLVRISLITLDDALRTGNYTVLRDMGAPAFREANSAARLSRIFSDLAAKNVDLASVAVIAPQLSEKPGLDQEKGMLHLKGYFPGRPVQINFDLLYQAVAGRWRLFGISVQPGTLTSPGVAGSAAVKK